MDDQPPPMQPPPPSPSSPIPPPLPPVTPPPIIYTTTPARSSGVSVVWKVLSLVLLALFCLFTLIRMMSFRPSSVVSRGRPQVERTRGLEETILERTNGNNKIAIVSVDGVITSANTDRSEMNLAELITDQLKTAQNDSDVKAVILKVNSPGGEVLASDEINRAIRKFEDESHKPVVASMGALAASGGYYVSVPCRWIVANELTITGSIGVIMETWNYRHLMDKVGVQPFVFKSGRFKDMLSGEREPDTNSLSEYDQETRKIENDMVQSLINETYHRFRAVVKSGRGAAADQNEGKGHALADNWQDYADGRVLSGKAAMDLGFVDELGDFQTAVKRAESLAGISSASLVEYHVAFDFQSVISHLFGKTETPAVKLDLGFNAPQLKPGCMYYILPMAVLH